MTSSRVARGRDDLYGGAGDDNMKGGKGRDLLLGGVDEDTLNGGKGRDRLDGGYEADTLTGGKGADMFIFYSVDGDHVTDFSQKQGDKIDLIPTLIDQNPCAHWRRPMDMMRQGWSVSSFQASQQWSTMSS